MVKVSRKIEERKSKKSIWKAWLEDSLSIIFIKLYYRSEWRWWCSAITWLMESNSSHGFWGFFCSNPLSKERWMCKLGRIYFFFCLWIFPILTTLSNILSYILFFISAQKSFPLRAEHSLCFRYYVRHKQNMKRNKDVCHLPVVLIIY